MWWTGKTEDEKYAILEAMGTVSMESIRCYSTDVTNPYK